VILSESTYCVSYEINMDGRKKLSGANYRKNAKEKRKKIDEIISKTTKIDKFVITKSSVKCVETVESEKTENLKESSVYEVADVESEANFQLLSETTEASPYIVKTGKIS